MTFTLPCQALGAVRCPSQLRILSLHSTDLGCVAFEFVESAESFGKGQGGYYDARRALYNFCRRDSAFQIPAMTANVTTTLWSLEGLYNRVTAQTRMPFRRFSWKHSV
jgi:hypothetical protein